MPKGNDNIKNDLIEEFSSDLPYIEENIPLIKLQSKYTDTSINAMNVSGATGAYNYIQNINDQSSGIDLWKRNSLEELSIQLFVACKH